MKFLYSHHGFLFEFLIKLHLTLSPRPRSLPLDAVAETMQLNPSNSMYPSAMRHSTCNEQSSPQQTPFDPYCQGTYIDPCPQPSCSLPLSSPHLVASQYYNQPYMSYMGNLQQSPPRSYTPRNYDSYGTPRQFSSHPRVSGSPFVDYYSNKPSIHRKALSNSLDYDYTGGSYMDDQFEEPMYNIYPQPLRTTGHTRPSDRYYSGGSNYFTFEDPPTSQYGYEYFNEPPPDMYPSDFASPYYHRNALSYNSLASSSLSNQLAPSSFDTHQRSASGFAPLHPPTGSEETFTGNLLSRSDTTYERSPGIGSEVTVEFHSYHESMSAPSDRRTDPEPVSSQAPAVPSSEENNSTTESQPPILHVTVTQPTLPVSIVEEPEPNQEAEALSSTVEEAIPPSLHQERFSVDEKILQETTIEVSNDSLNIVPNPSSTTPSEATKPHHKDRKTVSSPTILHTKVPKSLPSLQTIQGSPTNAQVTTTTTTTTTTPKNRKEYVCRDYIYGVCKRGKDCRFSHVLTDFYPKEIADLPREVPVCKNYLKGKCTRADCRFRHPKSTDADYNDIMAHHASTTTNLLNVLEYSTNIESFKSPYIFL